MAEVDELPASSQSDLREHFLGLAEELLRRGTPADRRSRRAARCGHATQHRVPDMPRSRAQLLRDRETPACPADQVVGFDNFARTISTFSCDIARAVSRSLRSRRERPAPTASQLRGPVAGRCNTSTFSILPARSVHTRASRRVSSMPLPLPFARTEQADGSTPRPQPGPDVLQAPTTPETLHPAPDHLRTLSCPR